LVTDDGATGDSGTGRATGKAMPDGLKGWLIASVVVLLGSLALFVGSVVAGFAYFTEKTAPLWVTVVGVVAVLGIAAGFGGLLLVLVMAAAKSRKDDRAQSVTAE
jgi:hypothetical protein